MLLLPKTPYDLKTLRTIAKSQGYKVKSQQVGFEGNIRIVWGLIHVETKTVIDPFSIVSPEKYETYRQGYELLKSLCRGENAL